MIETNMRTRIVAVAFAWCTLSPAAAQPTPLTCSEFVLMVETAVQHRDTGISKAKAQSYLHEDTLSSKENSKVRDIVSRIYAQPAKGREYFAALARKQCGARG